MLNVTIKNTKKYGRGLYATRDFKKGEIIERSPLVVLNEVDSKVIHVTILCLYAFEFNKKLAAIALGNGSLFNHSKRPNVIYDSKGKEMIFRASKGIKKGEQLFIDYGYDPIRYKEYYK